MYRKEKNDMLEKKYYVQFVRVKSFSSKVQEKMNINSNKLCLICIFTLITVKDILSVPEGNTSESSTTTTTTTEKSKSDKNENTILNLTKFDTDALLLHNVIRGLHHTMPLSLSIELKRNAMKSASKLLQRLVSREEKAKQNSTEIEISQQGDDDDDENVEDGTNWYIVELNGTTIAQEDISAVPAIFEWYAQNKYYTGPVKEEKSQTNQTTSKKDSKNTEIVPTTKWRKASALPSKESSTRLNVRPLAVKLKLLESLLKFQLKEEDLNMDNDDGAKFSEEYYPGPTEKAETVEKNEKHDKKDKTGKEEKSA